MPQTIWSIRNSNRDLQDCPAQHCSANLRHAGTGPAYLLPDSPTEHHCKGCWICSVCSFRSPSTSEPIWASHLSKRGPPRPGYRWDPRQSTFFKRSHPRHPVASSRTTKDRRRRRWRWQQEEGWWRQWRRSSLTPLLLDTWLHWSRLTCMFAQEA